MIRRATASDAKEIAQLHELVLPCSIFVRLGKYFLESYYHRLLASADHVFSFVYVHEGRIAGFVAVTTSHKLFYSRIRRDFLPLSAALLRSAIASPRSCAAIAQAALFMLGKEKIVQCDAEGELLQIAVRPDCRARMDSGEPTPFFAKTGVKVAEALFIDAVTELRKRGVRSFRIMTGDANAASNRFYSRMGCKKIAAGMNIFGNPTSLYRCDAEDILGILDHPGV